MSSIPTSVRTDKKLFSYGLRISDNIHYQSTPDELITDCLVRGEGILSDKGALVIRTGEFTGRSPRDRFIVRDELTAGSIDWNDFNQPLEERHFEVILNNMRNYLNGLSEIWLRDCRVCADPDLLSGCG